MRRISVSISYATPDFQWLKETSVARGTNAGELIELSGYLNNIEELRGADMVQLRIGVYAQRVELDYLLQEGDRLEIYRSLKADPKAVRRQLALLGKTMGKNSVSKKTKK